MTGRQTARQKIASTKIAHDTAPAGESRVDEKRVDVAEKGVLSAIPPNLERFVGQPLVPHSTIVNNQRLAKHKITCGTRGQHDWEGHCMF